MRAASRGGRLGRPGVAALALVLVPACATILGVEEWGSAEASSSSSSSSSGQGGGGGAGAGGTGGGECGPCAENPEWGAAPGGLGEDRALDVAVDPSGNVYVSGFFSGSIDFSPPVLSSSGGNDAFVAKYDPEGKVVWAKNFGGMNNESGVRVLVVSDGVVLIGQTESASIEFDAKHIENYAGSPAGFALKLDGGGQIQAIAKLDGMSNAATVTAGAVDPQDGGVLLVGSFTGTIDLAAAGPMTSGGEQDIFAIKLDPNLQVEWGKRFGGTGSEEALGAAAASNGQWVVVGAIKETFFFGLDPLPFGGGPNDAFVAKLASNGEAVWAESFGGVADDVLATVAIDPEGAVLVGGYSDGLLKIGEQQLPGSGKADILLAKLALGGAPVWGRRLGGAEDQVCNGIASDAAGNVWVAGSFLNTIELTTGNLVTGASTDGYLIKLDRDGKELCGKALGGSKATTAYAVGIGACGHVVLAGWFGDKVPLAETRTSKGLSDAFVVELAP